VSEEDQAHGICIGCLAKFSGDRSDGFLDVCVDDSLDGFLDDSLDVLKLRV